MADPEKLTYVRATAYALPFYSMIPPVYMQASVPLDSENTAMYLVWYDNEHPLSPVEVKAHETFLGLRMGEDLLPDYRRPGRADNRWFQDREGIKSGKTYTGLYGTTMQDIAVQESMGPIHDRTQEYLSSSDVVIIRARQQLIASLEAHKAGWRPWGLGDGAIDYAKIRATQLTLGKGEDWRKIDAFEETAKAASA